MTIQGAINNISSSYLGLVRLATLGLQSSKWRVNSHAAEATPALEKLTSEQQSQVDQLKKTDQKVRAHEQAHLAVGTDLVRGGVSFTYEIGPDRKRYAVAGEVSIDTSPANTPEDTIPKAQHIRATALAPAEPSPQDHTIAAQASRMEVEARMEVNAKQAETETGAEAAKSGIVSLYRWLKNDIRGNGQLGHFVDVFA